MLSKNMYEALTNTQRPTRMTYHDGRTLAALRRRGLIHHSYYKSKANNLWYYTISKRGYLVRNDLLGMTPTTKRNVFAKWEAGR